MSGPNWNDDESGDRDRSRPLNGPETPPAFETVSNPAPAHAHAQPPEPAMAHAARDSDQGEADSPEPQATPRDPLAFVWKALELIKKIPLPSMGSERHEMLSHVNHPSPAPHHQDEPEPAPSHDETPPRFSLLTMKRETRVGIAALVSFVVLVGALVVQKKVGGGPKLAVNGPEDEKTKAEAEEKAKGEEKAKADAEKPKNEAGKTTTPPDPNAPPEVKTASDGPIVPARPSPDMPPPDVVGGDRKMPEIEPSPSKVVDSTRPAPTIPVDSPALPPMPASSEKDKFELPVLAAESSLPPVETKPAAAATATATPNPPADPSPTPIPSPASSLPAPSESKPAPTELSPALPAAPTTEMPVTPSLPVVTEPPVSPPPSLKPEPAQPPALAPAPALAPMSSANPSTSPVPTDRTPPMEPTPSTSASASAPTMNTPTSAAPPSLAPVEPAATPVSMGGNSATVAVDSAAALGAGWVAIQSGGRRTPGSGTIVSTPSTLGEIDQPVSPRVADGPRPRDDFAAADQFEPVLHTVQAGENFWTISKSYYNSPRYYKALHAANARQVPDIRKLYIGTVVQIPPIEKLDRTLIERETSPVTKVTKKANPNDLLDLAPPVRPRMIRADPEIAEAPPKPTYKVKATDTLRSIARDTLGDSKREKEILNLNRDTIDDPKNIPEGTILTLPEDATTARRTR